MTNFMNNKPGMSIHSVGKIPVHIVTNILELKEIVGVVLEDEEVVLAGKGIDLSTSFLAHIRSRRVTAARVRVHKL